MRRALSLLLPLLGGGLVLGSCGSPEGSTPGGSVSGSADEFETTSPSGTASQSTSPVPDPALAPLVELARRDLAVRLRIPESEIVLVSARAVVWGDGSLGCPRPGMQYTQVPVDGALIILADGHAEYRYHNGGSREPFLCTS